MRNGSPPAGEVQQTQVNGIDEAVKKLVADQYARVWQELTATKLRLDATVAGVLMAKNLQILDQVDTSEEMLLHLITRFLLTDAV